MPDPRRRAWLWLVGNSRPMYMKTENIWPADRQTCHPSQFGRQYPGQSQDMGIQPPSQTSPLLQGFQFLGRAASRHWPSQTTTCRQAGGDQPIVMPWAVPVMNAIPWAGTPGRAACLPYACRGLVPSPFPNGRTDLFQAQWPFQRQPMPDIQTRQGRRGRDRA